MKKAVVFLFIFIIITLNVFSQDYDEKEKKEKTVSILFNPLLFFSDVLVSDYDVESSSLFMFDLDTHIRLSKYTNLSFSIAFLFGEYNYSRYDSYYNNYYFKDSIFQVCFKPMFIHRPFGTGIKGFYLGIYPSFSYTYVTAFDSSVSYYFDIGAGVGLGYKWTFRSGLTLQTGFGIGKTFPLNGKRYSDLQMYADGRIRFETTDIQLLEFKVGYSF